MSLGLTDFDLRIFLIFTITVIHIIKKLYPAFDVIGEAFKISNFPQTDFANLTLNICHLSL